MPTLRRRRHEQPMPPSASPQTLPRPGYPYASWWRRGGAYLIDIFLAGVPFVFVVSVGLVIAEYHWLGAVIAVLGFFVYLTIAVSNQVILQGKTGQSLGKKCFGIAVIGETTGRPLGQSRALARWGVQLAINLVGRCLPLLPLPLNVPGLLNSLWPLWDAKNQTWHDKVVQSIVVRIRPDRG